MEPTKLPLLVLADDVIRHLVIRLRAPSVRTYQQQLCAPVPAPTKERIAKLFLDRAESQQTLLDRAREATEVIYNIVKNDTANESKAIKNINTLCKIYMKFLHCKWFYVSDTIIDSTDSSTAVASTAGVFMRRSIEVRCARSVPCLRAILARVPTSKSVLQSLEQQDLLFAVAMKDGHKHFVCGPLALINAGCQQCQTCVPVDWMSAEWPIQTLNRGQQVLIGYCAGSITCAGGTECVQYPWKCANSECNNNAFCASK